MSRLSLFGETLGISLCVRLHTLGYCALHSSEAASAWGWMSYCAADLLGMLTRHHLNREVRLSAFSLSQWIQECVGVALASGYCLRRRVSHLLVVSHAWI